MTETTVAKTNGRAATQFKKGNPGRPKGTRNVLTLLEDALKAAEKTRARLHEPCACVLSDVALLPVDPTQRQEALATLWDASCKSLDEHFARQAYRNPVILTAFQKKRVPDLQHQVVEADADTISGKRILFQVNVNGNTGTVHAA